MAEPKKTNENNDAKAESKKEFDEYLEKSSERRKEMEGDLAEHKEENIAAEKARKERAQEDISLEYEAEQKKKQAMREWREAEAKRKKDVEEMKKQKMTLEQELERKRKEKEEYEKKHKQYMKDLETAAAIKRLEERRKIEAHKAKLEGISTADSEMKKKKLASRQEEIIKNKKTASAARKERGDLEGKEKKEFAIIDEDIRKEISLLMPKEQTEMLNVDSVMRRKRSILKSIVDPSLLRRTRDELDREEKRMKNKIRMKYEKMRRDLEVERSKRIDALRIEIKQASEGSAAKERQSKIQNKRDGSQERLEAELERHRKVAEAKEEEASIMAMDLQEMAEKTNDKSKKSDEEEEKN